MTYTALGKRLQEWKCNYVASILFIYIQKWRQISFSVFFFWLFAQTEIHNCRFLMELNEEK